MFKFFFLIFGITCKSEGGYWYVGSFWKIPIFGIFLSLSFFIAFIYLKRVSKNQNLPEFFWEKILIIIGVFGFFGARLFHALETNFSTEGLTWYGGFLFSAILILLYVNQTNFPIKKLADDFVFPVAFGYSVGRLGCFFSGDGCYGIACPNTWVEPFCMAFPDGVASWQDVVERYKNPLVKVYNTPLWEATFSIMSYFFFRTVIQPRGKGTLFFSFLFAHAANRFYVEFLRQNPKVFGIFTQAQVISLILAVISVYMVLKKD